MIWSLKNNFTKNSIQTFIEFEITTECSLSGTEVFVLILKNPKLITDQWGNRFQQSILQANSYRYTYISETEKQVLTSTGAGFSTSSYITLGFVVIAVIFQYKSILN